MNKKILISLFLIIFTISCSTLKISETSKYVIMENAQQEVIKLYDEKIEKRNIMINKVGYGQWNLVLYGKDHYYPVTLSEEGEVLKTSKINYSESKDKKIFKFEN